MRPKRRQRMSFKRRLLWLVVLAILAYIGITFYLISRQAARDEARPADVIIVFGAAEYAGRPSPIYRARLDHGFALYQKGLAKYIIATGGRGDDPTYSEGGVGRDYLIGRGVPERNVIAETQSDDTSDSARRVANIMRANGMKDCIAVSDAYHLYRIKRMMGRQGVTAYASPRPPSRPMLWRERSIYYLREVLSITLWRLHIT